MKKVACAVIIFIMIIFLVNPLSSDARGGFGGGHDGGNYGGGHGGGYYGGGRGYYGGGFGGWWAPWAVIGGAAVLAPYYAPYYSPYYDSYYHSPYYTPQPVAIQEQPPIYVQPAPSSSGQIFVYPRQGQSEELQARDRYECHSWAVSQTNYDPTQPPIGISQVQLNQLRSNYLRATDACLDARGYTMK
jgi:hypothetical protein